MMSKNAICVFILALVVISACEARSMNKKKLVEKKHFKITLNNRAFWPANGEVDCDAESTFDSLGDLDSDEDGSMESWPNCGRTLYTGYKSDSKMKKKWRNFQKEFSKLEQSLNNLKKFGKKDDGRIVNGQEVSEGEWPWLAAIGKLKEGARCGASIIGDRWLITAAHCFDDTEKACEFNARFGTRHWLSDSEGTAEDRRIAAIYRHHGYDGDTKKNDIALLKLESPLDLDPDSPINAICLPGKGRAVEPGTTLFTAGWGQQAEGDSDSASMTALSANLPLLSYDGEKCGSYDEDQILPGMLCAGYSDGTTDTCQGDSGGPLVYQEDGQNYLLGVVSWGNGCAKEGYPGIYTDVGQFLPWINAVITSN